MKKIKGEMKLRKIILLGIIVITFTVFGGCVNTNSNFTNDKKDTEKLKVEESKQKENENNKQQEKVKREKGKKIEVKVEGELELRDAELAYNDNKDYSLYVLVNYTFAAEEPNKDIIFSNFDGDFFVRIEKLGEKANIDELNQSFTKAYSSMGNVIIREPSTVFADKFKDSKLWLHVDIPKSDNIKTQTSINYLLKDFNGVIYAFTFHMPLKEAMEGITPSLWAMVSTIEVE